MGSATHSWGLLKLGFELSEATVAKYMARHRKPPSHTWRTFLANSPWQNAYVERLIGSIRRECLDHVIVLNETSLRRILKSYFDYYESFRTHLSLNKDAPAGRAIEPPGIGRVMEIPQVGGLHHLYTRKAA